MIHLFICRGKKKANAKLTAHTFVPLVSQFSSRKRAADTFSSFFAIAPCCVLVFLFLVLLFNFLFVICYGRTAFIWVYYANEALGVAATSQHLVCCCFLFVLFFIFFLMFTLFCRCWCMLFAGLLVVVILIPFFGLLLFFCIQLVDSLYLLIFDLLVR